MFTHVTYWRIFYSIPNVGLEIHAEYFISYTAFQQSSLRPGFDTRSLHVGHVVNMGALGTDRSTISLDSSSQYQTTNVPYTYFIHVKHVNLTNKKTVP
jgi:hypothetical protein